MSGVDRVGVGMVLERALRAGVLYSDKWDAARMGSAAVRASLPEEALRWACRVAGEHLGGEWGLALAAGHDDGDAYCLSIAVGVRGMGAGTLVGRTERLAPKRHPWVISGGSNNSWKMNRFNIGGGTSEDVLSRMEPAFGRGWLEGTDWRLKTIAALGSLPGRFDAPERIEEMVT